MTENELTDAEVKDRILDAFRGTKTLHVLELKNNKSIHENYFVIENNLNYLIGADLIRNDGDNLYLSPMGIYTISDLSRYGFAAIEKLKSKVDDQRDDLIELTKENLKLQNRDLKRKLIYSVVSFFAGAIVTLGSVLLSKMLREPQLPPQEIIIQFQQKPNQAVPFPDTTLHINPDATK